MTRCVTCGSVLTAVCSVCKQPLKRFQKQGGLVVEWVHVNPGGWLCDSKGEPVPVAV